MPTSEAERKAILHLRICAELSLKAHGVQFAEVGIAA
jgi:hypothetical protein